MENSQSINSENNSALSMTAEAKKQLVLGLTGAFGSGCSTLVDVLIGNYKFEGFCLSDPINEEWCKNHLGRDIKEATRDEKQDIGNEMRTREPHFNKTLAFMAYERAQKAGKLDNPFLVFDSIRNTEEVEFFRTVFANFYLVAVDCVEEDRWLRVQEGMVEIMTRSKRMIAVTKMKRALQMDSKFRSALMKQMS
jgi:dephospho-CoA kinase